MCAPVKRFLGARRTAGMPPAGERLRRSFRDISGFSCLKEPRSPSRPAARRRSPQGFSARRVTRCTLQAAPCGALQRVWRGRPARPIDRARLDRDGPPSSGGAASLHRTVGAPIRALRAVRGPVAVLDVADAIVGVSPRRRIFCGAPRAVGIRLDAREPSVDDLFGKINVNAERENVDKFAKNALRPELSAAALLVCFSSSCGPMATGTSLSRRKGRQTRYAFRQRHAHDIRVQCLYAGAGFADNDYRTDWQIGFCIVVPVEYGGRRMWLHALSADTFDLPVQPVLHFVAL